MPLNISTKPSPPSSSSQNRSTGALIWSPASICEKETASAVSHIITKREIKHKFIYDRYHYDRKRSSICSASGYMNSGGGDGNGGGATTDSDDNTSYCVQNDSDNNTTNSSTAVYAPFSPKNVGFFTNFQKHHEINMLRQNRTDIFVVNNNNEFMRDKEAPRPDSTAHHSDIGTKNGLDERRREHRCFQVRF